MDLHDVERLSRISTHWSALLQAHGRDGEHVGSAQQALLLRYSGAVYRYLLGAVRDPDTAVELSQEFAVRLLRGAFRNAQPRKGRFRDYVKTVLIHLVDDYHSSQRSRPGSLPPDVAASGAGTDLDADDRFLQSWRQELLDRTWKAIEAAQPTYHAVLLLRVSHPEVPSAQMAEQLSTQLGTRMSSDQVRKALQRSRVKFAELLLEEVATSLENPSHEELAGELSELDLLKYCRSALERRS
jgi:RNA polymerase sigma-70 factor (ECF subfamily)